MVDYVRETNQRMALVPTATGIVDWFHSQVVRCNFCFAHPLNEFGKENHYNRFESHKSNSNSIKL